MKKKLTKQQREVASIEKDGVYTVRAVAGSGKTYTALEYIKNNPNESILYLVFNSSNRADMKSRLENLGITKVDVHTVHSYCYGKTISDRRGDFYEEFGYVKPNSFSAVDVSELLNIKYNPAFVGCTFFQKYLYSNMSDIDEFMETVTHTNDNKEISEKQRVLITKLVHTINNKVEERELPMPHDYYVKWFSENGITKSYDTVIVDEAQDVSEVMLKIVDSKIEKSKLMFIGDGDQWIYGWRDAVNAMELADQRYDNVTKLQLSSSWRVGPQIARISELLNGSEVIGNGKNELVENYMELLENEKHNAVLGFTNMGLFSFYVGNLNILEKKKLYFRNFDSRPIWNMINFAEGKHDKVYDARLLAFNNWSTLWEAFIKYGEDNESSMDSKIEPYIQLISLIKRYTIGFLKMVLTRIYQNSVKEGTEEVLLSTVHSCKGSEFESMILLNDMNFNSIFATEKEEDFIKEVKKHSEVQGKETLNVLYVALTRAMGKVSYQNDDIAKWYKKLIK